MKTLAASSIPQALSPEDTAAAFRLSEGKEVNFKKAGRTTLPLKSSKNQIKEKGNVLSKSPGTHLNLSDSLLSSELYIFFKTSCAGAGWWMTY